MSLEKIYNWVIRVFNPQKIKRKKLNQGFWIKLFVKSKVMF